MGKKFERKSKRDRIRKTRAVRGTSSERSEWPFRCEWNTCTVSHLSEKFIVTGDPLKEFSRMRANSTGERARRRECVIERIVEHFSHANTTDAGRRARRRRTFSLVRLKLRT